MSLLLMQGNALTLPLADESVHCVVTSPPYWGLRDYGLDERGLGLEPTPEQYVENMVAVFREVRRVLRDDGTVWLNLGDSYASSPAGNKKPVNWTQQTRPKYLGKLDEYNKMDTSQIPGLKPKDLCGIPWRVAFALQADGWWLRSDIIWSKPNPMPESVTDRPTKAHEYLFLLTKSARYYYDADAVREENKPESQERYRYSLEGSFTPGSAYPFENREKPQQWNLNPAGRNRRTVWQIPTAPYSGAHFATYPPALVEPCIKAGTSERGVCPECGAPWERVVEKGLTAHDGDTQTDYQEGMAANRLALLRQAARERGGEYINESRTVGWRPTCEHYPRVDEWQEYPDKRNMTDEEYEQVCAPIRALRDELVRLWEPYDDQVPAIVFDPFCGSGTTSLVARKLERHGVGMDLSLEYLHLARERLSLDALDKWIDGTAINDNGKDLSHKNKNVPGRTTHSFHDARKEKELSDLPLFGGVNDGNATR